MVKFFHENCWETKLKLNSTRMVLENFNLPHCPLPRMGLA